MKKENQAFVLKVIESGRYSVSKDGKVYLHRGRKTGQLLCNPGPNGYILHRITAFGGVSRMVYAHQIVCLSVYGEIQPGMQCNHLDGDKTNNHPKNLQLVTASENMLHAYRTGLTTGAKGTKAGKRKLSEGDVTDILFLLSLGKRCGFTQAHIAKLYGVHPRTVSLISMGKTWMSHPAISTKSVDGAGSNLI